MKGFLPIVTGFLLVGLVVVAIFMGSAQLKANNDDAQGIEDIPGVSETSDELTTTLEGAYGSMNSSEDLVTQSPATETDATLFPDAIVGVWVTMKTIPIATYNVLAAFLKSSGIGSPALFVFFSVIGSIIIVTVILYAWKVIRVGEPE